jgi:hypothetical protein
MSAPAPTGEWLTPWPDFCDGVTHRHRVCCMYGDVVRSLPETDPRRADFSCPCCPNSPCLSFYCYLTVGLPIPYAQTALIGIWLVAAKVRALRAVLAPQEQPADLCTSCLRIERSVLQMSREVEARKAAGVPVVPTGTYSAPPLASMTK